MPYTPSFTLTNLQALEQSIAGGQKEVQYDDKKVVYRTLDEMKQILEMMRRALGTTSVDGFTSRFGKIFTKSSKGLE